MVILSVGSNDVLPDADAGRVCDGDAGASVAAYIAWALATTPECRDTTRMARVEMYDTILSTIGDLRDQAPTKAIALNVYDRHLQGPDLLAAGLSDKTLDTLWPWMTQLYDDWNRMLCAKATTHFFDCVDLYHAFNGPAGDLPSGDLLGDGAHPSQAGHDLIADLLAELDLAVIQAD